jgi:hypothetical protein
MALHHGLPPAGGDPAHVTIILGRSLPAAPP